jgi:cytochrome P450
LSDFSRALDNVSKIINYRFDFPAYTLVERILPYARNLKADLDLIHRVTRELVQEGLERIRQVESGEKDAPTGRDLLLRRIKLADFDSELSDNDLADVCLNYILAGES